MKTIWLCLIPVLASAQIIHVQSAGKVGRGITVTPKHTGDLLVVFAGSSRTTDSLNISDSAGNTWTALNPATSQSGQGIARSWYAFSRAAASTTISVTSTGAWADLMFDEFSGVSPSAPLDKVSQKTGSGTSASGPLTPVTNNELVWAGSLGTITGAGTGYVKGADDYSEDLTEYRSLTGGSGIAQTATFANTGPYLCLMALFKPAVSAGSPPAISSFIASPSTINKGQSSTLSWTSSGGTSATLNGGSVAVSGNQVASPSQTTTYTLVVNNSAGSVSRQVTVTVNGSSTYSISGKVSGSAATLTLSGASSGQTKTDASGNYSFSGLANGTYLVAPSQSGYSFSPSTASRTINGANITGVNFTASTLPPPVQHTVSLSWKASTSPNISGYNVYRGTVSGGPYTRLNGSLDAGTNYADKSVISGMTYFYVTTAVNSSGGESSYSSQVAAVVPMP
jgi:hypothetical protein